MKKNDLNLNGFSYFVSDEQLALFASLTDFERLNWLDNARLFTLMAQTPQTKIRHEQLRNNNNR
jgi:hypothetical protein